MIDSLSTHGALTLGREGKGREQGREGRTEEPKTSSSSLAYVLSDAATLDDARRCEMSGRWLVKRVGFRGRYRWVALEPQHRDYDGTHGPTCDCYPFTTHAEAIAYADRMARMP